MLFPFLITIQATVVKWLQFASPVQQSSVALFGTAIMKGQHFFKYSFQNVSFFLMF